MGITVDVSQLESFAGRLSSLTAAQSSAFMAEAVREMANALLELVIPRTPVGNYSGGGTLRMGWMNLKTGGYNILRGGGSYTITLTNPVYYASYVEYGHRQTPGRYVPALGKCLVKSWVEGQHFLKISEDELQKIAPRTLQKMLDNFLKGVM